jgi:hypothetical protein
MEQALSGLQCKVMQSTSDEAPGLLAYVEHHLGAHHSPDLFHVHHALSQAVSAPMALKQRAAGKVVAKLEATRKQVQESLDHAHDEPTKRRPGRPSKVTPCLAQMAQEVEAARHEHQCLSAQREQVIASTRAVSRPPLALRLIAMRVCFPAGKPPRWGETRRKLRVAHAEFWPQ